MRYELSLCPLITPWEKKSPQIKCKSRGSRKHDNRFFVVLPDHMNMIHSMIIAFNPNQITQFIYKRQASSVWIAKLEKKHWIWNTIPMRWMSLASLVNCFMVWFVFPSQVALMGHKKGIIFWIQISQGSMGIIKAPLFDTLLSLPLGLSSWACFWWGCSLALLLLVVTDATTVDKSTVVERHCSTLLLVAICRMNYEKLCLQHNWFSQDVPKRDGPKVRQNSPQRQRVIHQSHPVKLCQWSISPFLVSWSGTNESMPEKPTLSYSLAIQ